MILIISIALAITVIALVYVMWYNACRLEELESCFEEIDELNNEIKDLKQELEEVYEELASR